MNLQAVLTTIKIWIRIFLYRVKSFYAISYETLRDELDHVGIRSILLELFKSYLLNIKHKIKDFYLKVTRGL